MVPSFLSLSIHPMALYTREALRFPYRLLTDPSFFWLLGAILLVGEAVFCGLIILRVPYTEIDWVAYMQEVEGPLVHDEWNYELLKGDTGPLVYPAGFFYIYAGLWRVTDHGRNIRQAQFIFAALYVLTLAIVFELYRRTKAGPPWLLLLVCASRRVHSIFVLRLFNDGVAMLLLYASMLLFTQRRWSLGCAVYSLALSVKMNILLFAPAVGLLMFKELGAWRSLPRLALCAIIQVALAGPFLQANAWGYLTRAFNFGRQFFYIWSVNLKFLPEDVFLDKRISLGLLIAHVLVLVAFAQWRWCKSEGGLLGVLSASFGSTRQWHVTPDHVVTTMFTANFIGIVFARSLHYQFYVWYFHTLPLLVYKTNLPVPIQVPLLIAIEVVWNVFPSNAYTSTLLLICHAVLLGALWISRIEPSAYKTKKTS